MYILFNIFREDPKSALIGNCPLMMSLTCAWRAAGLRLAELGGQHRARHLPFVAELASREAAQPAELHLRSHR